MKKLNNLSICQDTGAWLGVATTLLIGCATVSAQAPAATITPPPETRAWVTTAAAAATLTRGNS